MLMIVADPKQSVVIGSRIVHSPNGELPFIDPARGGVVGVMGAHVDYYAHANIDVMNFILGVERGAGGHIEAGYRP